VRVSEYDCGYDDDGHVVLLYPKLPMLEPIVETNIRWPLLNYCDVPGAWLDGVIPASLSS
jgi:hypothetical protein